MTPESTIRQILEGMPLSGRTEIKCARCGSHLEGARVRVAARKVDAAGWHVVTVADAGCGPETVPETPFGPSALADARLGVLADVTDQSHRPALLGVEVVDVAWPAADDSDASGGFADEPQPDGGEVLIRDDDRGTLDEFGIVR